MHGVAYPEARGRCVNVEPSDRQESAHDSQQNLIVVDQYDPRAGSHVRAYGIGVRTITVVRSRFR
jgi:hypothetical protein